MPHEAIAILSTACRFPGASSPEAFFERLCAGYDAIREVPPERWSIATHHDPTGRDPTRSPSRWGAFLDDPYAFDAAFFELDPDEAAAIDPQQRIALMVAHELLERAGYASTPSRRALRVGVFVGAGHSDHDESVLRRLAARVPAHPGSAVGSLRNVIAARIARRFDLDGPVLVVDTACSSTLVAVHLARRALLARECDLAIAGGVSLHLTASAAILLGRAGALSPTGGSRPFSALADGMTLGEGCGMLLLARHDDALANDDTVLALVRGSAVGNDGATLAPMAPRPSGQIGVTRAAWREAGLDPATATYVEAHGTGTRVGDAVEAQSIAEVFGAARGRDAPLAVGTAKGNIGHLLAAAGSAGLLKVVESLAARRIPPSLHASPLSPKVPFDRVGIAIPDRVIEWRAQGALRAGVNAFGFGGTNAHVILEEAPRAARSVRAATRAWELSSHRLEEAIEGPLLAGSMLGEGARACELFSRVSVTIDGARAAGTIEPHDPLVADHRVHGRNVLPAAGATELLRAALEIAIGAPPHAIRDIVFRAPLVVDAEPRAFDVSASRDDAGDVVAVLRESSGLPLATAKLGAPPGARASVGPRRIARAPGDAVAVEPDVLYAALAARSMAHGAYFRALRTIEVLDREAWADLELPARALERGGAFGLHPALLDAALQPVAALLLAQAADRDDDALWVPSGVDRVVMLAPLGARASVHLVLHGDPSSPGDLLRCDVAISTERGGEACVLLEGAVLTRATAERMHPATRDRPVPRLHTTTWEASPSLGRPAWSSGAVATVGEPEMHAALRDMLATTRDEAGARAVVFVAPSHAPLDSVDALDRAVEAGPLALLELARRIDSRSGPERATRLVVVVRGAHRIDDADAIDPIATATMGLAMALGDEIPGLEVAAVDLRAGASPREIAEAIAIELAERGSSYVAHRGERRLARGIAAGDTNTASTVRRGAGRLRRDGVYLVTGGATGIGFEIAKWLATEGRTSILTGRRALEELPDRGAAIDALAARGARVRYLRCDVGEDGACDALISEVLTSAGALHGVIHGAGVVRPMRLRDRAPGIARDVLAPKVRGTWLLLRALRDHAVRPDFVALFSSISASVPGLGGTLADYVAANAFLDGAALSSPAELGVRAIAWSNWAEVGMGADRSLVRTLEERGLPSWPTRDALLALEAALETGLDHVIAARFAAPAARARAIAADARSVTTTTRGALLEEIRSLVGRALGVPPTAVSADASLSRLGLDSLVAIELVKTLETRLGVELPTTLFFDHDSIAAVAAALEGREEASAGAGALRGEARGSAEPGGDRVPAPRPPGAIQRAFVLQQRLAPGASAFSLVRVALPAAPTAAQLADVLATLAARHPMLRARFLGRGGEVALVLDPETRPELIDAGVVADLERATDDLIARPFDLVTGPLLRAHLARDHVGTHLTLCAHHAIADAWSMHVLAGEALDLLAGGSLAEPPGIESVLAAHDAPAATERDVAFFAEAFSRRPDALTSSATDDAGSRFVTRHEIIDSRERIAIERAARDEGLSSFHVICAAYLGALAETFGATRIALNVARARREARVPGIERVVGCLADALPLVLDVDAGEAPLALARRVREAWRDVEAHGTPTSIDLAALAPRDRAPGALADASFSFARFPLERARAGAHVRGRTATAATRLGLAAYDDGGDLVLTLTHAAPRVASGRADALLASTLRRLGALSSAWSSSEASAPGGAIETSPPAHPPLAHQAIVASARARAEQVAFLSPERGLETYGDLDRASAAIAAALARDGAGPGTLIGVLGEPSPATAAAILGTLRAGAGWVPLDPADPPAWRDAIVLRTGARRVLTGGPVERCLAPALDIASLIADRATTAFEDRAPPLDGVAYVAFTSGSSGPPKGVPITHGALARYLAWLVPALGYRPTDVTLGTAPLVFDASVRQLLGPLAAGARVLTLPRATLRDPDAITDAVLARSVTVLSTLPSMLARITDALGSRDRAPALRMVQSGGESLSGELARRVHRAFPGALLANLYGPTEATVNAAFHVRASTPEDEARVPIGHAAAGALLVVRDDRGEPAAEGELWIGGPQLSAGYLDDEPRTARAFVRGHDGERYYRTGDRVRRRADGALEMIGRLDDQVKIRGRRVDPGDVEAALLAADGVREAIVRAEHLPEAHLVAWVVPREGAAISEPALMAFLRARAPEALVPRRIHVSGALAETRAGKIDRRALADGEPPGGPGARETPAPGGPTSDLERIVQRAFATILRREVVLSDTNFFDAGGDSMAVLTLFDLLASELPALPRPVTLYDAPTPRALAHRIAGASSPAVEVARASAAATAPTSDVPLSAAQRGFLVAHARGASITWWARLPLEGPLDADALDRALELVSRRHPMLRARFSRSGDTWRQWIDPDLALRVERVTGGTDAIARLTSGTFDLASDRPLIRVALARRPEGDELVVFADHLVGDAISGALLANELVAAHDALARGRALDLPAIPATFAQIVAANERALDAPERAEHVRRAFARPYRAPSAHHTRPEARAPDSGPLRSTLELDAAQTEALARASRSGGHTLFEVLFAAFARACGRLASTDDLVVGTALSGRDGPRALRVFGPLVSMTPVRVSLSGSWGADLATTTDALRAARAAALPFSLLARHLPPGTAPSDASGEQFFLTFVDVDALAVRSDGPGLGIRWDLAQTSGTIPDRCDVHLAARRANGTLRLQLAAAHRAMTARGLAGFRDSLADELRAAADHVDTVLVGYLPEPAALARAVSLAGPGLREVLRARAFPGGRPRTFERIDTRLGRAAFVMIPRFADELTADALDAEVERALVIGGELGARGASLAGMLPARTGYGRGTRAPPHVALTTGHATTAVSIVLCLADALSRVGARIEDVSIAFVGLGSVGAAACELGLEVLGPPRRVVLSDLPRAAARTSALADRLARAGARDVVVSHAGDELAGAPLECDVIVGASSGGATLDPARVAPGTIVLDDSFPHLFDVELALARMETRGDALFAGAGLLDVGPVTRTLELPPDLEPLRDVIERARPRSGLPSCLLEPLLRLARPDLAATSGLVELASARSYFHAARSLGIRAAPLHLGSHEITAELLERVRGARSR